MYVFSMQCINEMDTWKLEEFPNAFTVSNRRKIYIYDVIRIWSRTHWRKQKKNVGGYEELLLFIGIRDKIHFGRKTEGCCHLLLRYSMLKMFFFEEIISNSNGKN